MSPAMGIVTQDLDTRSAIRVVARQLTTQRRLFVVARYHFNIRNGHGYTADDEGMDLSSDDEARRHAITGARSLLSAEVLDGLLDLNGQIEVTDCDQASVMT